MMDNIIDHIEASIYLNDGTVIRGSFDSTNNSFSFNGISKVIKIEKVIDEQNAVVSYMFDTDYLPRRFHLSKYSPVIIEDYLPVNGKETYVKIMLKIR